MVGNDDSLVIISLGSLNHLLHAVVDSPYGFGNGIIYTCVAHHVAVSEVDHDEVVFVLVDGSHQFVLHLVSRHLGLQVVGSHLWRGHQDAVLTLKGSLATTIEEESHVCILLRLGSVQLLLALTAQILAQRVLYVLLGEQDVYALERCVVRRHTIVLQIGNGLHALGLHVLLCQHDGQLLGTVVTEVDEDDDIALLYQTVHLCIVNGLDELVRHALVIRLLHGLNHVGALLALTFDQQVVGFLDTLPPLVAVHGIEATYDGGNSGIVLLTLLLHLLNESLTALGIGVTTIHETVYESLVLQSVVLAYLNQLKQMVQT